MVGNGVRKLLERAMPLDERNDDNIEAMREHFREYYDAHLWDHTTVYPGMRELLDELVTRDVKFAVASNKYQSAVDRLIQHFFGDLTWAAVYGQREGVPVKPDPSVVFEVLTDCPTAKDDVLYVGDSGVDMETARRACVESVGVTWGFRSRQELVDGYADHIVDNADDILSLL
jgi:phosphoglycolate phosphatase